MSKREPSSMGDDDENSQSLETPAPKIARTNVFAANGANNASFGLMEISAENLQNALQNAKDESTLSDQQPGPSRNDSVAKLRDMGTQTIKFFAEDKQHPITNSSLDGSRGGASPPFSIDQIDNPELLLKLDHFSVSEEFLRFCNEVGNTGDAIKNTEDAVKTTSDAVKNTEDAVKNTSDAVKNTEDAVKNTGDEKVQRFLQDVVKDPTFLERFKRFILADSESVLITGERERDPRICQDSQESLNSLRSAEPEVVAGHAAAALQQFLKQNTSGGDTSEADNRNPIASTSGCGSTQMQGCLSPSAWVDNRGNTPVVYTQQEGRSSLPKLATSVTDYIPHTNDPVDSAVDTDLQPLTLPDQIWEKAFDFAPLTKRNEKIRKMGQTLFQGIFDKKEIVECRVRDDKIHKVFDPIKVRFVHRGVAWLLGKPAIRSQEVFDQYVQNNGPPLTEEDASFLRKAVFGEFAYNQRIRIKKAKTNNTYLSQSF